MLAAGFERSKHVCQPEAAGIVEMGGNRNFVAELADDSVEYLLYLLRVGIAHRIGNDQLVCPRFKESSSERHNVSDRDLTRNRAA